MKDKNKISKLVWKYFLEQKVNELVKFVGIFAGVIFVPFLVGKLAEIITGEISVPLADVSNIIINIWFSGLCVLLILAIGIALGGFVIWVFYMVIRDWIISNWNRAVRRAEDEDSQKLIKKNERRLK